MDFIREEDISLAEYLPMFITNDAEIQTLLSTESKEHNLQRTVLIDILKQFFISSATWGLDAWEKVFAIYSKPNESYELRRAKIYTKLQSKQISTVKFLTHLAKQFFPRQATVEIKEKNPQNLFYLIANCTALDGDYFSLCDAMEIYKPAHLAMIVQHYLDAIGGIRFGGIIQQANVIHLLQDGAQSKYNGELGLK